MNLLVHVTCLPLYLTVTETSSPPISCLRDIPTPPYPVTEKSVTPSLGHGDVPQPSPGQKTCPQPPPGHISEPISKSQRYPSNHLLVRETSGHKGIPQTLPQRHTTNPLLVPQRHPPSHLLVTKPLPPISWSERHPPPIFHLYPIYLLVTETSAIPSPAHRIIPHPIFLSDEKMVSPTSYPRGGVISNPTPLTLLLVKRHQPPHLLVTMSSFTSLLVLPPCHRDVSPCSPPPPSWSLRQPPAPTPG
jgi:hypothetical protein